MTRVTTAMFVGGLIVAALAVVVASCASGSLLHATSAGAQLDEDLWAHRMRTWLRVAYTEDNAAGVAAFSNLTAGDVASPSLLETYYAIRVLDVLDLEVESSSRVCEWIGSLALPSGVYDDPAIALSPLFETYAALEISERLSCEIRNPGETVAFVRSLRRPDGMFAERPGSPGSDEYWFETHEALEVLRVIADEEAVQLQRGAIEPLTAALEDYLRDFPEPGARPAPPIKIVMQVGDLARLQGDALDGRLVALLREGLTKAVETQNGRAGWLYVRECLEALAAASVSVQDMVPDLVRYVTGEVLPDIAAAESSGYAPGDVIVADAYDGLSVARRTTVGVNASGLVSYLRRRHIDDGWPGNVVAMTSPMSTASALVVARMVGFEDFDRRMVETYLTSYLVIDPEDPTSLLLAYYAQLGLKAIDGSVGSRALGMFEDGATQQVLRWGQGGGRSAEYAQYWYARNAVENGWSVPSSIRQLLSATLRSNESEMRQSSDRVHRYAFMREAAGEASPAVESVVEWVLRFRVDSGGFRSNSGSLRASVSASLSATEGLAVLNSLDAIDKERLGRFVLSCKADYGFQNAADGSASPSLRRQDLLTAANALTLLDLLVTGERNAPASYAALLPYLSRYR